MNEPVGLICIPTAAATTDFNGKIAIRAILVAACDIFCKEVHGLSSVCLSETSQWLMFFLMSGEALLGVSADSTLSH